MTLSERHDLRGGTTSWEDDAWGPPEADPLPTEKIDVAIIGAGVMGSILAERLSAEGYSLLLLDRRPPGLGSTAASTAQIMWAMDVPFCKLAEKIGEVQAARRWTRVYKAVRRLADHIDELGIACERRERVTLYLEGKELDCDGLRREAALHRAHGLPTEHLDAQSVAARFGIPSRSGLVSQGGFDVDPVKLAHGMLNEARKRGARICYPIDVLSLQEEGDAVTLSLNVGRKISASRVIFAGGYERAMLFLPADFSLLSTFVMATEPGLAPLWQENAMIWEATDPYLYVRTDIDGRIIAGGEDERLSDSAHRNAKIGSKAGTIAAKLGAMLGRAPFSVDRAWAATFGISPDGLPAIGRAANMRRTWLSAGFGGNGIAFAALAAELLTVAFTGTDDPDAMCFDPYRFATA